VYDSRARHKKHYIQQRSDGSVGKYELLNYIKDEVAKAAVIKNKDAVNMYLVIKYAEQLKDINPLDFALAIGRNESYATEFRKGLNLARVIKERGL
jgi:hypothetical protein